MNFSVFPMRQVHLDFHTSPEITDVGADWDAAHFVQTLTQARVNSINVFAKCHHGLNYYPSEIGPVHPHLKFDLLGAQIAACHQVGIRCPIYISVGFDVSAAQRHPEWRQVNRFGNLVGAEPLKAAEGVDGWPWMCLNNGYADELIAQTQELMSLYDCDGFWYDILWYEREGCVCENCLSQMRLLGLNPENARHRDFHNKSVLRRFMQRASAVIRTKSPTAVIFYNRHQRLQIENEIQHYSQLDIESLPTGGWGYNFYPLWSRLSRNMGLPMVGMTGRFHRSWADWGGLKHPDALRWECGGILATGGAICIGDQMHPRGRLNEAVYKVIGEVFRDVEQIEEYCRAAQAVTEVGLLLLPPKTVATEIEKDFDQAAAEGASKMLLELHQQYDVITANCPDFGKYKVLVVPDVGQATPELSARLQRFVAEGGKLLLSHQALLDESAGNFHLAAEMGLDYSGPSRSNPDYFMLVDPALQTAVTQPGFAYSLYEGPASRVKPYKGTQILADAYETYFNRTWEHFSSHGFTPPRSEKADYPAVTRNENVIYVYGPIFSAYQKYGNLTFRGLVGQALKLLLPTPMLETDAPATTEVSLMQQNSRLIVHIVNYHAGRRTDGHVEALEKPVPLYNTLLQLRQPNVQRVFLADSGEELAFTRQQDYLTVMVPRIDVHAMMIFE